MIKNILTIIFLSIQIVLFGQEFQGNRNDDYHFKLKQIERDNTPRFAYNLAPHENTLVVANSKAEVNGHSQDGNASIYAFDSILGEWVFDQKIEPWGYLDSGGEFGTRLAMNSTHIACGAYRGNDTLNASKYVIVYVFEEIDSEWIPKQKLFSTHNDNFRFGRAISMSDSLLAIEGGNHLEVFDLNETSGLLEIQLILLLTSVSESIEVSNNQLIFTQGDILFIYEKENANWNKVQSIRLADQIDSYGTYTALHGDYLAVSLVSTGEKGTVQIFSKNNNEGTWSLFDELDEIAGFKSTDYGRFLDIDNDYLVFGN
jgi:hypothetical protein